MDEKITALEASIHELALGVRELVVQLNAGQQQQAEKNVEQKQRTDTLEAVMWRDPHFVVARLEAVEKNVAAIAKDRKERASRTANTMATITGSVLVKAILGLFGLAIIGAGFALMQGRGG